MLREIRLARAVNFTQRAGERIQRSRFTVRRRMTLSPSSFLQTAVNLKRNIPFLSFGDRPIQSLWEWGANPQTRRDLLFVLIVRILVGSIFVGGFQLRTADRADQILCGILGGFVAEQFLQFVL